MIKIRTRPINTRPARASTELSRMSSMRAVFNSQYCMRAVLRARSLNSKSNGKDAFFSYQEGRHKIASNGERQNGSKKPHLPEEVKIAKTKNGKRWTTSFMEVELEKDIIEVRDGLGKVVDALILKHGV